MIQFAYSVTEICEGEPSEDFGTYLGDDQVAAGDVIMLKWLDGRDAYQVRVVSRHGYKLRVTKP